MWRLLHGAKRSGSEVSARILIFLSVMGGMVALFISSWPQEYAFRSISATNNEFYVTSSNISNPYFFDPSDRYLRTRASLGNCTQSGAYHIGIVYANDSPNEMKQTLWSTFEDYNQMYQAMTQNNLKA